MGKGTITEIGETPGNYTITIDYGSAEKSARLSALSDRADELNAEITAATAAANAAITAEAASLTSLYSAISAYNATDKTDEDKKALDSATVAAIEATAKKDKAVIALGLLKLEQANVVAQAAALNKVNMTQLRGVWCADYTTSGSGDVALIEIDGDPDEVLIAPGAPPYTSEYGELVAREIQSPEQVFFNGSLLPGWQKFMPTYRTGRLSHINRGENTGTVTLNSAKSSAQNLNINQSTKLQNVPIEYGTCHAAAFVDNDDVVVKFENQDWKSPKVIGFRNNPRPCAPASIFYYVEPLHNLLSLGTTWLGDGFNGPSVSENFTLLGPLWTTRNTHRIEPGAGGWPPPGEDPEPIPVGHTHRAVSARIRWDIAMTLGDTSQRTYFRTADGDYNRHGVGPYEDLIPLYDSRLEIEWGLRIDYNGLGLSAGDVNYKVGVDLLGNDIIATTTGQVLQGTFNTQSVQAGNFGPWDPKLNEGFWLNHWFPPAEIEVDIEGNLIKYNLYCIGSKPGFVSDQFGPRTVNPASPPTGGGGYTPPITSAYAIWHSDMQGLIYIREGLSINDFDFLNESLVQWP